VRPPVSSEESAFRAVLVVVALTAASTGFGYLLGSQLGSATVGTALFCIGVLAAIVFASAKGKTTAPIEEAELEGEHRSGRRRILLVANVVPSEQQLSRLRASEPDAVLDVHAPVLQSRTHFATTDIDDEIKAARQRLRATMKIADRVGLSASGGIGDAIDPLAGVADELRRHHIDRVVITSNSNAAAIWMEADLRERLQAQLRKPVSVIHQ
jgi:hypothetical protein